VIGHPARNGDIDVWTCRDAGATSDAIIHKVLERYPGPAAPTMRHARDAQGRPFVPGRDDLGVSVSHAGDLTLVAIGVRCRVGVDVEPISKRGLERLRYHALTGAELLELEGHDPECQTEVLLGYWTRKEALLKAVGVGLAVEPRLIDLAPNGVAPHPISVPAALGRPCDWSIAGLDLDGYIAAVAADVQVPRVRVIAPGFERCD
jgi:4'-phosphopantetheinyl transferase